jgi:hypothetical protein
VLIVDPWDWLDPNGEIPIDNKRTRSRIILILRVIEYGSPLGPGMQRETLIECKRRPSGIRCSGLLVVEKRQDEALLAYCPECNADQILVHNWQKTKWAD